MDDIKQIAEDLTKLRAEIDDAKSEKDQLVGAEQQQLENIKKTFGVKNDKEGEKLLKKLDKELAVLEKEIGVDYKKLKEDFEW
jgi:hypothetical protein